MSVVYSYIRFSSAPQERGSSIKRQAGLLNNWMAGHPEHTLDTTLKMRDYAVSAFRGANLDPKTGDLGKFIALVKQRPSPIAPNSILALEHLDRFSRDEAWIALHVFTDLLKCGIRILTLDPERLIDRTNASKIEMLMPVVLDLILAHEASVRKSGFSIGSWQRLRGSASTKKMTKRCPNWLQLSEDRTHFDLIPEAVATIKKMWQWALDGMGAHIITTRLNQRNIPTISKGKKKPKIWLESFVNRLLTDPALHGQFQPKKGRANHREAVGDPIPDYFPEIIHKSDFQRIQKRRQNHSGGRLPRTFVSLFPRLIRDASDKSSCVIVNKGRNCRIVSQAGKCGKGKGYHSFSYVVFEQSFLHFTRELKIEDISPHQDAMASEERMAAIELSVSDIDERIATLRRKIDTTPTLALLMEDVERLVVQKGQLIAELDTIRQSIAFPTQAVLHDTTELITALSPLGRRREKNPQGISQAGERHGMSQLLLKLTLAS